MKLTLKLAMVLLIGICSVGQAQEMGPAMPTTAPAEVTADTRSPRGSLKVMAIAMSTGDAAKVRQVFHASTPTEEKMRSAMAEFASAIVNLRGALEAAFGKEQATALTGDSDGLLEENHRRVDAATESIDGDNATVQIVDPGQGGAATVHFKKVESDWQILIENNGQPVEPQMMEAKADELSLRAAALSEAADELKQDKTKTLEQVAQSIQAKMMAAMMQKAQTQPATAPSTQPHSHDH